MRGYSGSFESPTTYYLRSTVWVIRLIFSIFLGRRICANKNIAAPTIKALPPTSRVIRFKEDPEDGVAVACVVLGFSETVAAAFLASSLGPEAEAGGGDACEDFCSGACAGVDCGTSAVRDCATTGDWV